MMTVDYINESFTKYPFQSTLSIIHYQSVIDRLETVVIGAFVNKSNAQHW